MNDDLALSIAAEFIKPQEGYSSTAYLCSAGKWTIGYGHTDGVKPGMVWSRQHAEHMFKQRLVQDFARVKKTWPGSSLLHPAAQAALISLVYNRGASLTKQARDPLDRRREMRELRGAIAERDYVLMAELFRSMKRLWMDASGKAIPKYAGLLARRDDEADLCLRAANEQGR